MQKINLLYIGIATLFISCSATNRLTMGSVEPAAVFIPSDIKNVAIINRSLPSKGNNPIDQIDKILSAEGLQLDKKGAEAEISALSDALVRSGKFDNVKILDGPEGVKKGLGVLPATLSWDEVESICEANGVDVLFSLAFYDTDTQVSYNMTTMEVPNPFGVKVAVPAHEVTLNTAINNGWRIYDVRSKTVLDEYVFNQGVVSQGKGINPVKALEAIKNRDETVVQSSKNMGSSYSQRLFPYSTRIARDYFVRGTDNFKIGKRRAQTGDWDGAAQLWEKELTNPNPKIAGRACYNMAIINEINGDLPTAMDWASKSYADYKNKDALQYLNLLKDRVWQNEVLEYQSSR